MFIFLNLYFYRDKKKRNSDRLCANMVFWLLTILFYYNLIFRVYCGHPQLIKFLQAVNRNYHYNIRKIHSQQPHFKRVFLKVSF